MSYYNEQPNTTSTIETLVIGPVRCGSMEKN